jgi:ActR/RegA family two-component response regulator
MECRHFPDRDPANNCLDNLQWGTRKENEADKIIHKTDNSGERNGQAKLSARKIQWAKTRQRKIGEKVSTIAIKLNVSRRTLERALNGNTWKHVK